MSDAIPMPPSAGEIAVNDPYAPFCRCCPSESSRKNLACGSESGCAANGVRAGCGMVSAATTLCQKIAGALNDDFDVRRR